LINPRNQTLGPNMNFVVEGAFRAVTVPKGESIVRFRPSPPTARLLRLPALIYRRHLEAGAQALVALQSGFVHAKFFGQGSNGLIRGKATINGNPIGMAAYRAGAGHL